MSEAKETEPNLKLADRPFLNISKHMKLMHIDIKTLLFCLMKVHHNRPDQQGIEEYSGVKFSFGLSLQFFTDENFQGRRHMSKNDDKFLFHGNKLCRQF